MRKIIGPRLSALILLILLSLLLLLHVLIIFKLLPSGFIWGGRTTGENLIELELLSIFILLVFILVTWLKLRALLKGAEDRLINVFLWIMSVYFFLNTLGNLASEASLETWIFTPLSLIMALLALRIAVVKKPETA